MDLISIRRSLMELLARTENKRVHAADCDKLESILFSIEHPRKEQILSSVRQASRYLSENKNLTTGTEEFNTALSDTLSIVGLCK